MGGGYCTGEVEEVISSNAESHDKKAFSLGKPVFSKMDEFLENIRRAVNRQQDKAKAYKQEDLGLSDASHNIR